LAVLVVRNGECVREVTKILILLVGAAALGCRAGPEAGAAGMRSLEVRMLAHDTTWHAAYILSAAEVPTGREVHVPLGAYVTLDLLSRDFISDFALPAFGLRDFAAPGLPSAFRFRATRPGRYVLRGDELCGRPHDERTRGVLVVEDAAAFRAWLRGLRG
jgi:cytochrome c oxidase subunit 2